MKFRIPLAVAGAILLTPVTALAVDSPEAGCAASRDLLTIEGTLARIDYRIYDPAEVEDVEALVGALDANGDGYLCSKQFKPNKGQDKQWGADDYVITQIGDNQTGRTPEIQIAS